MHEPQLRLQGQNLCRWLRLHLHLPAHLGIDLGKLLKVPNHSGPKLAVLQAVSCELLVSKAAGHKGCAIILAGHVVPEEDFCLMALQGALALCEVMEVDAQ
eukprot:3008569-Alexandrium_andersonii.AAC.1